MQVKEFMTTNPITLKEGATVEEAAKIMTENNISCLPVVDASGSMTGMITESDFVGKKVNVPHALTSMREFFGQKFYFNDIEKLYETAKGRKVEEVMSKDIKSVAPETTVNELALLMTNSGHKRFPVLDKGKLVGVITRKDMIKTFVKD